MSSVLCFHGGFPEREPEGGIERVEIKNVKEKTERSMEIGCILVEVTAMLLRKRAEGDETAGSSHI